MSDVAAVDRNAITPILITPFDEDGELDVASVEAEVDHLARAGVSSVGVGFASEVMYLTEAERGQLVGCVRSGGLQPIGNLTVSQALAGEFPGDVQQVLLRPDAGTTAADLAGAVDRAGAGLSLILQDAPQHSGVSTPVEAIIDLLQEEAVIGVKLESPDAIDRIAQVRERFDGAVPGALWGGAQGLSFLSELLAGVDSTMPGTASVEIFQQVLGHFRVGRFEVACRVLSQYLPVGLVGLRGIGPFIAMEKALLVRRGIFSSTRSRIPVAGFVAAELDRLVELTCWSELVGLAEARS